MKDSRAFASGGDEVGALCTRCRNTCPPDAMSCPSCGADLAGETVLDDVHSVETVLIAARAAATTTASHVDTTPDGEAFASQPPTKAGTPSAIDLSPFAEDIDEEDVGHVTAEQARASSVAQPRPAFGSSSDPPTRFLRGIDHHIELPSGSTVDDYEIEARLGEGAMGVVYGARHVKLGRRVAIKVIAPTIGADPQALARFEREAQALASLHHPNIVDVYAFGALADGRSYFAMEYLVGETLDDRLDRGRLALDEALDVVDQMARALEAAHAQGIVHRDLKPSNTFLVRLPREQRPIVKLLDFGLVKLAVADGLERTASGAVIGTALYIAPEQVRSPNVDGRADVYGLGCVAYELVLGRHPFPEARTPTAAIAAHLTEPPPQPRTIWSGIPAALDLLLYSMLAKDPIYRPTLAQVRSVIADVRSPSTAAGRAMRAATESAPRDDQRSRVSTVTLIGLALVVGIAIGARVVDDEPSRGTDPTPTAPAKPPIVPVEASAPTQSSATALPDRALAADADTGSQVTSIVIGKPMTRPAARPAPPQAVGEGVLALDSKPWTDVLVDGERRGRTPIVDLRLPVGRHKITLINATYAIKESFRVEIKHAQMEKVVKDYSDRPEVRDATYLGHRM